MLVAGRAEHLPNGQAPAVLGLGGAAQAGNKHSLTCNHTNTCEGPLW